MERLDYEERHDWDDVGSTWVTRYDTTQEYDKNGNRTRLHKNVAAGFTASYGEAMDLSYTFSNVNALTAIADADDALYSCAVTSDANNNITAVQETATVGAYTADLYTYFSYDWANRLGNWWVRAYDSGQKDWQITKREHGYDAAGRLINSTYKQWWESGEEPAGDSLEHTYAGSRHIQNYDGSSTYGEVWHWAGAQNAHAAPVKSPNPDTASQAAFNIANDKTPQRMTWQTPTTAGDERNLYGQGKPMAKDSSGAGADWGTGITSYTTDATVLEISSRFDFDGTVAPTDLDRATDAREKGRIGIFGSQLSYAGSSGRVTSEPLGRDLNPLGRGSGAALVGGAMNLGKFFPVLPANQSSGGTGNSINNCGQCGDGCGDSILTGKELLARFNNNGIRDAVNAADLSQLPQRYIMPIPVPPTPDHPLPIDPWYTLPGQGDEVVALCDMVGPVAFIGTIELVPYCQGNCTDGAECSCGTGGFLKCRKYVGYWELAAVPMVPCSVPCVREKAWSYYEVQCLANFKLCTDETLPCSRLPNLDDDGVLPGIAQTLEYNSCPGAARLSPRNPLLETEPSSPAEPKDPTM